MPKVASFFLSRIIKSGVLDVNGVLAALRNSPSIESRDYAWTVLDVGEDTATHYGKSYRYLTGRLVKYDRDALVEVVDESTRKTRLQAEPNMQQAASLFVYLPDEAVFGHKRVWNEIRPQDFRGQVTEIILAFHKRFMVECRLEPVSDLTRFLTKLSEMDSVTEIKARVSPPNPLFGVFWQDLKKYLDDRRLRQMTIKEAAKQGESLPTTTPEIARRAEAAAGQNVEPAPIGDAAVLMAADGYGSAAVTGKRGGETVVVKTSENAIHLKLNADITPAELAQAVVREVSRLNRTRGLRH